MKKNDELLRLYNSCSKKLIIMRNALIILLISTFQVVATSSYSQITRLSLDMKGATVKEVLSKIEDDSEFYFLYNSELVDVNRKVNVSFENEKIETVLNQLFDTDKVELLFKDRHIIISPKENYSAQQEPITGKVTDENGEPLPGVTVIIEGTTNGTVTNVDGAYTISNVPENATLQFSFVGMLTQEVTVGKQTSINIVMKMDAVGIDEVIAIGYGTTTKRTTTAAVSKIKTDNLVNLPVTSIGEALAGRTAGLIVTNNGGGLGKRPTISVRGGGSPILIIDGVTTSNMDEMHRMNPKDIESFTILKDAQAVAIYGSKGGNGAIVITTKRGIEGQFSINYGYSHNYSQPTILPSKLGSYDLATIRNQAADNDKQERPYTDEIVQKYKDQSDPFNYPNTDWQKEVLNDFAQESKHDLSIMGGNEKAQYYTSLSYFDQGSMYKLDTDNLKRYTYRMSVSNKFEDIGLKTNLAIFGDVENTKSPYSHYSTGYWQTWGHIQNKSPMEPAYTDLGLYASNTDHPIVETDPNSGYNRNEDRNLNVQLDLEWSIPNVKGLKFKMMGYYRNFSNFRKSWQVNADQYALGSDVPLGKNPPRLDLNSGTGWKYRVQPLLSFERDFKKHRIEVLAGYDETYTHIDAVSASRENYVLEVDQIFSGPTGTAKNNGYEAEEANAGYVGRLKYSFDNKYMIEGSIRYDGNDKFPKDKRWGTFYSGSVGWNITEEKFAENITEKLNLDLFKLRFSYGETGLDDGVDRYEYVPGYSLNERAYVVDGNIVPGFNEGSLVSPDITWFERKSINAGVDFAMFNNKIYGSADYFFYETVNYLGSPSGGDYTDPLGTALPKINTEGKHRRAGFEFEVKYQNKLGELNYNIGANLTAFDELWVVKHDEAEDQLKNPNKRETHQKGIAGSSYLSEGYYSSAEDIINQPKRNNSYDIVPGDLKYTDVNGDGQIDGEDFVRSGKPSFPRIMYGFTIDLNYKAWSAGMHFQGVGNRHIYLGNVVRTESSNSIRYPYQTDFWTPENNNSTYPRLMSNASLNGGNNQVTSDFWQVNARYFRMKSLQVSYDFKRDLLKNLPFSRCDLFLSGTNLFTIANVFSDYKMDPETDSTNNYGYPLQRIFSVGVNVGF